MYKKIILLLVFAFGLSQGHSQTAKVQIIHNSPDITIDVVDIWVNNQMLADSLAFRNATAYLDMPAGSPVTVSVMNQNISDTSQALYQQEINLTANDYYVLITTGLISDDLYDSLKPFKLAMHQTRRTASQNNHTDVLVYHGAPEEPPVRINETTLPLVNMVDSLPYDNFTNYLELPTNDYELEVVNTFTNMWLATYAASLSSWTLEDSAIVLLASGFVDSLKNNPGDTISVPVPAFGLYAALPSGGALIKLPAISGINLVEYAPAGFTMYPNPSTGLINLEIDSESELVGVSLYSMNGSLLKTLPATKAGSGYRVDAGDALPGPYLLNIKLKDGSTLMQKLILR